MGKSLQDQLLSLGLAKEKPARRPGKKVAKACQKPARTRSMPGSRAEPESGELSLERAYALKRQEEKNQADQARKRKQAEDRRRRLLNNQIREIVKANRLNKPEAEATRNFLFRGRIRKIRVTPDQLKLLNAGELGIVYLSGGYHLLDKEHTDAIRELSAEHVPDLNTGSADDDGDHPVPDDLTW